MVPRVFENIAVVTRDESDRLCDIERRTAADADDPVRVVRLVRGLARVDLATYRIAPDLGEYGDVEAGQFAQKGLEHGKRGQRTVRDNERTGYVVCLQMIGDQLTRTGAEMNRRGEGETMNHLQIISK